jgi:hypothetical protein
MAHRRLDADRGGGGGRGRRCGAQPDADRFRGRQHHRAQLGGCADLAAHRRNEARPAFSEIIEQRAARLGSVLLFVLTIYVVAAGVWGLWTHSGQPFSAVGLVLAAAAIPIMVALAYGKTRIAYRIGSRALRADAVEAIACAYLSGAVVVGLLAQRLTGAWWVDSITALALAPFLVREALEAWRGEAR